MEGKNNFRWIILSVFFLFAISEVIGTTYYISPFGSDLNSGITASSPFKTFKYSLSRLSSQGTLKVLPGLYSGYENNFVTVEVECTIISTEGADQTIITGPGQWTIYDYVTISGIQFTNFPSSLFYIHNFNNALVLTLNNITANNNNLVIDIDNENIYIDIKNSIFKNNKMITSQIHSTGFDGGVTMENTTVANGDGGISGFYKKILISNSTFTSMKCEYQGCAISLNSSSTLLINQTIFNDCISSSNGGAIWLSGITGGGIIIDSIFEENSAVNGGAIYSQDSIEIGNTKFISNYASDIGGGVFLKGNVGGIVGATIEETLFEKNTAVSSAGAVYCENSVVYYRYVDFLLNYAPIGESYQCGSGCSTYLFNVFSNGNSPSCSANN